MIQIKVNNGRVESVNYSDEKIEGWIEIPEIPEPERKDGFVPVMYYRNGKVEYEYSELPPLEETLQIYLPKVNPEILEKVVAFFEMESEKIKAETDTFSDAKALKCKALFPTWVEKIGHQVEVGERLYYDDKLFKVRQVHKVQQEFPPSVDTASLYEEICEKASGTVDDPIPYNGNMRLELGKYYIQDGTIYKCTRDSEVAVYNPLAELVGIYVE